MQVINTENTLLLYPERGLFLIFSERKVKLKKQKLVKMISDKKAKSNVEVGGFEEFGV